jgi:hypothetical protein
MMPRLVSFSRLSLFVVLLVKTIGIQLSMKIINGQVSLVRLVRFHPANFRLFLRKQMDKRQTSVRTMSKR